MVFENPKLDSLFASVPKERPKDKIFAMCLCAIVNGYVAGLLSADDFLNDIKAVTTEETVDIKTDF